LHRSSLTDWWESGNSFQWMLCVCYVIPQ